MVRELSVTGNMYKTMGFGFHSYSLIAAQIIVKFIDLIILMIVLIRVLRA